MSTAALTWRQFRIQVRFVRKDKDEVVEDSIYLGEIPIMIGGGEFIINGAERVIVNQLHRSQGVDFLVEEQEGDRPLHGCRVIPERGSWIECSVTKKDALAVRIDQSSKIPATTFLRALCGLLRAERTSVVFAGDEIGGLPAHQIVRAALPWCPRAGSCSRRSPSRRISL